MPTDATRRAALRSGPDLEDLPSLVSNLIALGINVAAIILNITLAIVFGFGVLDAICIVMPILVILVFVLPARRTVINRRNETRERNFQTVQDFYDYNDVLDIVPPSEALAERDAELERLYAKYQAAKGLLPNGDPLPVESNRAKKRRERQEQQDRYRKTSVALHDYCTCAVCRGRLL